MTFFKKFWPYSKSPNVSPDSNVLPLLSFTYDLIAVNAVVVDDEYYFYINNTDFIKKLIPVVDYKQFQINKIKQVYFTYAGICKILFTLYESTVGIKFQTWYADYICKNYQTIVSEIFSKFVFSCVYLLHVDDYKGHTNVYKFGRTDNFNRRYRELNKQYVTVFKIVTLQYIDPEYLSKAETEIQKRVVGNIIKIDKHTELFTISTISEIVDFYKELGCKYNTKNKKLQDDITKLQYENSLLTHKNTILELQMEKK